MSKNTLKEINSFLRFRKGNIGGYQGFRNTGLYEHHANLFGHLIYTEDLSVNYIGVDAIGNLYDETYYPYEKSEMKKVGTIVPKHLYELDNIQRGVKPHPVWKDVAEKGYGIVGDFELPSELATQCLSEGFIPHGHNLELGLSKTIHHVYFDPLEDKKPEDQITRDYLKQCTKYLINKIPTGQSLINNWDMHTADIKKYVYDSSELNCDKGAYSYHMDHFERCLYMFFTYLSKNKNINGRDLLVGKRQDFSDFSKEAVDLSPSVQPINESPFARLTDDKITNFDRIPINQGKLILINTINPMVVHKVDKLKTPNEVILLANYVWCKYRKYTD